MYIKEWRILLVIELNNEDLLVRIFVKYFRLLCIIYVVDMKKEYGVLNRY